MPRLKHSPPKTIANEPPTHSQSESNLAEVTIREPELVPKTSGRRKRPRVDDDISSDFATFSQEIREMLNEWKIEQTEVMNKLVLEVSDLKSKFTSIEKSNEEIKHSMEFINSSYETIKHQITKLEQERKEYEVCTYP